VITVSEFNWQFHMSCGQERQSSSWSFKLFQQRISFNQVEEHQSQFIKFPSSHCSQISILPFQKVGKQTQFQSDFFWQVNQFSQ
jgi:hypothetical protein